MALTRSELRVLAILGLVILILWSFFGLFWSLLLVFSFLIYAYNFGRHGNRKIRRVHEEVDSEPDLDLTFQEKSRDDFPVLQDLEFTGLPTDRYSLRSPTPLMSVTKRLSFNMSSTTPFHTRKAWNSRDMNGTLYSGRGSALGYHRKPHNFSLLNPALQRPSTVKIASPDVTVNRTFTLSNSPLKRAGVDENPCSRVTVLSALKESRKRSFAVFDEGEEEVSRPSKRRDTKPAESYPFSSPLLKGRKRVAIPERTEKAADGGSKKKSRVVDDSASDSSDNVQHESYVEAVTQKRKIMETEKEPPVSEDITESVENSGEDEVDSSKERSKILDNGYKSMETEHNETQNESASRKRKEATVERDATKTNDDKNESKSRKTKESEPLTDKEEVKRGKTEYVNEDVSSVLKPPATNVQKRFTVPRFASKDDSRRRVVPVYCASNEESEMPQRRTVSRKINQEQLKIDRKLAWERVNELLGGSDDDDDESEVKDKEKPDTTTVSSAAATSTSASLFKVPTAGVVTSRGTITTTTAQSLIAPTLGLGDPRRTTSDQQVPSSSVSSSNPVMHGSGTATQSQSSTLRVLLSQQRPGVDLGSKPSGTPGLSTALTGEGIKIPTSQQGKAAPTSSSIAPVQSQANPAQSSTVTTGPVSSGFQLSSFSSSGASPFAKPATTNPPTLNTNITSSQKAGFIFSTVSSSSVSGMPPSNASTNRQTGFNFSASNSTKIVFGEKSTQNTQVTTSVNSSSTFFLGQNTSQTSGSLASGNVAASLQSPFGKRTETTQNSSTLTAIPSTNVFGQSATAPQNSLASTTQNKGTFGVSNMQPVTGQQGQTSFGSAFGANGFGAKPSQNTPQASGFTQSPFTQNTFGQNASQSAFGANPTHGAFGVQQQNQPASSNTFGAQNANSSLNASQKTPQSGLGAQHLQNTFGSQQKTTQNIFGNQANQNVFGPNPNQSSAQNAFGTQSTQFNFGTQPNQKTTQGAFGQAPSQKSSPFTFAANTSQNASKSPFNGFGNSAGAQNTFGAAPSQNAAASSGFSFNANATANNPTPGGFNFSGAANKTGGFQFGSSASNSSFGQFGQATAPPAAVPATPAPSGGFNFAPGGASGSRFAAPTPAPAFGAPSTPQGAGSNLTARSRARTAARRRGKK